MSTLAPSYSEATFQVASNSTFQSARCLGLPQDLDDPEIESNNVDRSR